MRPIKLSSRFALLALLALASGCLYRMPIQQGNVLNPDLVAQLEPGMTRAQVMFLLGTPILPNGFNADRWDYFYYVKVGRTQDALTKRLTVWFKNEKVDRFDGDVAPKPAVPTTPAAPAPTTSVSESGALAPRRHPPASLPCARSAAPSQGGKSALYLEGKIQFDPATAHIARNHRRQAPLAREAAQRPLIQLHVDGVWRLQMVAGDEGSAQCAAADGEARAQGVRAALQHLGRGAAGHEFRITLDIVDQFEHVLRACAYERRASDLAHAA